MIADELAKYAYNLKYSDLSLFEIGEEVGYSSASSFNRVFKKTFDISPKKFKNLELLE